MSWRSNSRRRRKNSPKLGGLRGALVVLALCLFAMWVAGPLMRIIGVTGTNVANRLFGVV